MAVNVPSLSLQVLEEFDPRSPTGAAERRFLCPLCGEGKPRDAAHRSLSLNVQSGAWVCHRCGEKGKLAEWKDEKPVDRKTLRHQNLRRTFSLDAATHVKAATSPTAFLPAADELSACADSLPNTQNPALVWRPHLKKLTPLTETPGVRYLERRGITLDTAHKAGIRFSRSLFGRPAVVFPVRDDRGDLVAAQGRYIDGRDNPKARTVGARKGGVFATARLWEEVSKGAPVIITEAPIDALSLAECGFPALALCGKDGWPQWLPIRCAFKNVALALDADEAGEGGAQNMEPAFASLGAKVQRLRPEGVKDWNAMLLEQGREALADYVAQHLL